MALRRVELNVTESMYNGFRYAEGLAIFKERFRCLPEAAAGLKAKGQDGLQLMETLLQDKTFLCGDRLTIADLVLFCCVEFCASAGQFVDASLTNVHTWLARMQQRPSAEASLSPDWREIGLRA